MNNEIGWNLPTVSDVPPRLLHLALVIVATWRVGWYIAQTCSTKIDEYIAVQNILRENEYNTADDHLIRCV